MFFKERAKEPEIMDTGFFEIEEYEACLNQLGRIGKVLQGNTISLKAFSRLPSFKSVLDIGCGGGEFAFELAKKFPKVKVVGTDLEQRAIDYAKKTFHHQNLSFHQELPKEFFDIVTSTLVCHHLDKEALPAFLRLAYDKASQVVVINDLHRHILAYLSFALISPLLFRNRLIQHDGLLSIRKGFKRKDWDEAITAAGIPKEEVTIEWKWPFRWLVKLTKK